MVGVETCDSTNGIASTCLSGFALESDTCNQCPANCETCVASVMCQACAAGFSVNSGTGDCDPDISCPLNCDTCVDENTC